MGCKGKPKGTHMPGRGSPILRKKKRFVLRQSQGVAGEASWRSPTAYLWHDKLLLTHTRRDVLLHWFDVSSVGNLCNSRDGIPSRCMTCLSCVEDRSQRKCA